MVSRSIESLPITLRPSKSGMIPGALICLVICAFIVATWGNGPVLTSLISLILFGAFPVQALVSWSYFDEIFLRIDEKGFTISNGSHVETVEWNWVERFMIVRGRRSHRWVGWRYAAHYPPPKPRQRSTRFRIADEVLSSSYDISIDDLFELMTSLHAHYRSTEPQPVILRPALSQMLADAATLPMTLYPNRRSLLSLVTFLAALGAAACYWLPNQPITLSVIIGVLVLGAINVIREMNESTTYLRLDEKGFTHKTLKTHKRVGWDEVEQFVASDKSDYVGWRYLPGAAHKRQKMFALFSPAIDDSLTRIYGERSEDLASLLNHLLEKHGSKATEPSADQ